MTKWKPINTAPKNGSPVWVEGYNWGVSERGIHRVWAHWDQESECWRAADIEQSELQHLTLWMPKGQNNER